MIYYQIQTTDGRLVAGNMSAFSRRSEFDKNRNFSDHKKGFGVRGMETVLDELRVWIVAENEKDLLKSSKLLKKTADIYQTASIDIWKFHKNQLNAQSHILTTIQGQIRQKIEGFADDSKFYGDTYSISVSNINHIVQSETREAADLICYIHKMVADLRAHILGTEVVHSGRQYEIKTTSVSLRRAILNQCTPFLTELNENSVRLKFYFDETIEVNVDKNMFSLVMYNFFSNAAKYSKYGSEIRFNFSEEQRKLDVSMISLKMNQSEITRLFQEGERGEHAKDLPGRGIGLFVIQKALDIMGKQPMYIEPNYEKTETQDSRIYVENHFQLYL